MRKIIYTVFTASLLLAGCVSTATDQQPVVRQKEQIESASPKINRQPSMELVQSVEGEEEVVTMDLVIGHNSLYSMYIDAERYQLDEEDKKDVLSPVVSVPDGYPEVKMEILYIEERNPDRVKNDFEKEYDFSLEEEQVTEPVNSISLHGTSGTTPDSVVVTIYLLDAFGGTLLIKETYFLEAQEGHGARFEQILKTLELNE
ncbi:hypothetical protein [Sporosarcina sp.]|uniref:hypothetical protein n=1 Tax=Sporosarcina sp. TaxID=49982 RepID=UPI002610CAC5|nr:hypothetical protein [Sporosarcina sp.]